MDYDVLVIGSGAGGATISRALCEAGKRVALIERGELPDSLSSYQDESEMMVRQALADDRPHVINGKSGKLFTASAPGGGTALYGAALLRPSPGDFNPGFSYKNMLPDHLSKWPVQYEELEPYYQKAEDWFHVAGDSTCITPHLGKRKQPYPGKLPEYSSFNRSLLKTLKRSGVNPFPLPLGIDFDTCYLCSSCPGYLCPNDSRATSSKCCIKPAQKTGNLDFFIHTETEKLTFKNSKCVHARVKDKKSGKAREISAGLFIVAAGAVGTPALLFASGIKDKSDQLGRNYMYHCGALTVGLFRQPTEGYFRFIKQLGWTDDYFGTKDFPHKLGYVQALPIPGVLTLQSYSPVPLPLGLAKKVINHGIAFAATVEDLPLPSNRVQIYQNGSIHINHRFHSYDLHRAKYAKRRLSMLLRKSGALMTVGTTGDKDELHTAHQVGTARFGTNPRHSVLDPNCRIHSLDNVFVVDGSFMPTSLGVGPALTIIANALRVADYIIRGKR